MTDELTDDYAQIHKYKAKYCTLTAQSRTSTTNKFRCFFRLSLSLCLKLIIFVNLWNRINCKMLGIFNHFDHITWTNRGKNTVKLFRNAFSQKSPTHAPIRLRAKCQRTINSSGKKIITQNQRNPFEMLIFRLDQMNVTKHACECIKTIEIVSIRLETLCVILIHTLTLTLK